MNKRVKEFLDRSSNYEVIEYIGQLQQENKILRDNAEHNEKVVDKVNWENQLLKKQNKQLKDNWNKLWQYILEKDNRGYENVYTDDILDKMQELEGSDSNE